MTDETGEAVDIPDPERIPPAPPATDPSLFDPGSDLPLPPREDELERDDAYDPGSRGRQPDLIEAEEDYG